MALFARTSITDPELKRVVGRRRVLASGRGPDGEVLGLADALAWTDAAGSHELAWQDVERGGWNRETNSLHWTTADGIENALPLVETGQLPDLFNERVTASIACVRTVELAGGGTAVITARRNLGDASAPLRWQVAPGRDTTAAQVRADARAASELARLRAEYDLG